MTIYDLINKHSSFLAVLVKNELATVNLFKWMEIYEKYQVIAHRDGTQMTKTEKYEYLAQVYEMHPGTISRIINKLNKLVR